MPTWETVGPRGAIKPVALVNKETGLRLGEPAGPDPEFPLDVFSAEHNSAVARFNSQKEHGIQREHRRHGFDRERGLWRFRGTPYYLDQQGERLSVTKVLTDRARHNTEIYRVSTLMAQVSERYHKSPKDDGGIPHIVGMHRPEVRDTLLQCEQELQKLHVLAAAVQSMIDDASKACEIQLPERHFKITCVFDEPEDLPIVVEADGGVLLKVDSVPPPLSNGLAHKVQSRKNAEQAKVS